MPGSLEDLTSDQLLAVARQTQGSHELLQLLSRDPQTREVIQRAIKKARPDVPIPEIDAKDSVLAALKAETEARQALEKQILEDKVRARMESQRAAAKSKYGLTEADMTEVEKLMVAPDDPIPSYDAAARVHAASKRTGTPTPAVLHSPTYEMPDDKIWGKGIGNPAQLNRIGVEEAFKAFNEVTAGRMAGGGGLGPAVTN